MAGRYSRIVTTRKTCPELDQKTLPLLWLLSDARNDAGLEDALRALPRGSGFVFRHYHLDGAARTDRFQTLAIVARAHGHVALFGRDPVLAALVDADGFYGSPGQVAESGAKLRLAGAHDAAEIDAAMEAGADGIFLSPVFATASHPGTATLGVHGFHVLEQRSRVPVIALGGMTHARAQELGWPRWGAIDGLASPIPA